MRYVFAAQASILEHDVTMEVFPGKENPQIHQINTTMKICSTITSQRVSQTNFPYGLCNLFYGACENIKNFTMIHYNISPALWTSVRCAGESTTRFITMSPSNFTNLLTPGALPPLKHYPVCVKVVLPIFMVHHVRSYMCK